MKYMLTVQHTAQRVRYFEFSLDAGNNSVACLEKAKQILAQYKSDPTSIKRFSGNFQDFIQSNTITGAWLSEWVKNSASTNAWGQSSGGWWKHVSKI